MTAWRSSRFLPETRTWSPWVWEEMPLGAVVLDPPVDGLGVVRREAGLQGHGLAGGAFGRLLDLAVVEGLEGHLAPHQLLFQHLHDGPQAVLGG